MKKRILLITQNFSPEIGSAANRMLRISENLSEHFQLTVLTTEPQYPKKDIYEDSRFWQEKIDNIEVKRVVTKNRRFERNFLARFLLYLEVLWKLLKIICKDKNQYDLVFVSTPPLSIPLLGLFAKRKFKAGLIVDVRDLWPETLKAVKGIFTRVIRYLAYPIERFIYLKADEIIVNSEGFIPYIRKIVGEEKEIYFIPNSLTKEEFEQKKESNKTDEITIIYAGNLGIAQDLSIFLSLAERFKHNKKVHFLVIGYGIHYQEIKDQVKKQNLTNVVIKPPEPREKVFKRLQKADIAYMGLDSHPVFQTVIPGKVIDYMGAALPIIGITSGYSKHIIELAGAGVVLDKEADLNKLEEVVMEWIFSPKSRKCYGENGKRFATQYFNWEKNKKELERIVAKTNETSSNYVRLERISK